MTERGGRQKLKSGQAKAELSIAAQSNTTPTVPWSKPLCRSLPGSWITLTAYLLLVCMLLEGVTIPLVPMKTKC